MTASSQRVRADGRLRELVVVVTGAGRGIGRGIAQRLVLEGARVVLADVAQEQAEDTAAELARHGGEVLTVLTDLAEVESTRALVERTVRQFGRLDVLVNNAGIAEARPWRDLTPADWDGTFAVNARGLFFASQAAARQMESQAPLAGQELVGKIINIASIAGRVGRPMFVHYAASKAAVISITRSLALALAPSKITVNALCPGVVNTPMWDVLDQQWGQAVGKLPPGAFFARRVEEIPLGRAETPDDVAGVVAFLASADADYMTGQAINVDGGLIQS